MPRKRSKTRTTTACQRYMAGQSLSALSPLEREIVREQLLARLAKDAPTREKERQQQRERA